MRRMGEAALARTLDLLVEGCGEDRRGKVTRTIETGILLYTARTTNSWRRELPATAEAGPSQWIAIADFTYAVARSANGSRGLNKCCNASWKAIATVQTRSPCIRSDLDNGSDDSRERMDTGGKMPSMPEQLRVSALQCPGWQL